MSHLPLRPSAAAALLAAGAFAGCGGPGTPAEARAAREARGEGDVVIAVVWPWEAQKEVRYAEGLDLAVEEVNASGGIHGRPLRLRREDDGESVNEGILIAQRLAEDPEVSAVIGHLQSYVSVPAAAVYDLAGLVMLAPASTDPALTTKGYARVFRSVFTDEDTGRQMADFAAARGYRSVAIYYVRNSYGRTLANAFEERAAELGLATPARASYDPSQDREGDAVSATLEEWARMELDAVFLAGQVPAAGRVIAEMRRHGVDVPVLGGDALGSPALVATAGAAAEGTVVASSFHPAEPRPEVRRFVDAFRARFGTDPDPASAAGYDAVRVLAEAMRRAGSADPDAVARALHALPPWPGVTGEIAFDGSGNRASPRLVKLVVRGGRFEYLPEVALARAETRP